MGRQSTGRLEVRLDGERRRRLAQLSRARGRPVSEVVREMIDATYQREIQSARARAAERLAHLAVEAVPDPEELSEQLDGTYGLPDLS